MCLFRMAARLLLLKYKPNHVTCTKLANCFSFYSIKLKPQEWLTSPYRTSPTSKHFTQPPTLPVSRNPTVTLATPASLPFLNMFTFLSGSSFLLAVSSCLPCPSPLFSHLLCFFTQKSFSL